MHPIITQTPDQTHALGRCLGQQLNEGMIIRLRGDLGSGKTCFVQGLARGLGVPRNYEITSPTYTLINEYPGRLALFHVDLYRLEGSMDAEMIGLWEIFEMNAVTAVEWSERLAEHEWPERHLKIDLVAIDDTRRRIRLNGYGRGTDNLILGAVKLFEQLQPAWGRDFCSPGKD